MGATISIDKHVSNLDELLEIQPGYFNSLQFENKIPEGITQHLKAFPCIHSQIWKFYEDHKKVDTIKTLPIPLGTIQNSGFVFSSEEAYLILLIYKSEFEENCELVNFPHSLCGVVESVSNLTPRGLLSTFSSTSESVNEPPVEGTKFVESLESLLLSKRQAKDAKYKYMLFLWNGKNSSNLVKALAITKGYELDALLHAAKDPLLHILFSGGVIRHKKLQRGSVLVFSDMVSTMPTEEPSANGTSIKKARDTVYLLQWWLPQHQMEEGEITAEKHVLKYPRFTHTILTLAPKEKVDYFSRFEEIDEGEDVAGEKPKTGEEKKTGKREMPKLTFAMHKQPTDEDNKLDLPAEKMEIDDNFEQSPEDQPKGKTDSEAQRKGLGLPMGVLKTREEEAQELRKNPTQCLENVGIRDTNRREIENEMCSDQCTAIIKDFLYMGSDTVAQNKELLKSNKITHIINCAADYSDNYFPEEFKYKNYYLKDTVQEDIECCFYDTMEFVKDAEAAGGRVFVHCVQGISRSATLCIAYLIFAKQLTHQAAFALVQKERPIANPNMIFNVQLIWWYMRLYQDYSALPVSPRVYVLGSHQKEQPTFVVARLLMEHLYAKNEARVLDPRGVFVVHAEKKIVVWVGGEIQSGNEKLFMEKAKSHVALLQKHEKAPADVEFIHQGKEDAGFWELWGLTGEPEVKYKVNPDWDAWLADVELAEKNRPKDKPLVYTMGKAKLAGNEDEELQKLREMKPRLYTYPKSEEFATVFDFEDLAEGSLICLCVKNKYKQYIWKGIDFEGSEAV